MHELTVIANVLEIVNQVARNNALQKVDSIHLDIGKLQHLNEEIMEHGFEAAKKDTVADQAQLEIRWLHVKLECRDCRKTILPEEGIFRCMQCGSNDTEIIQGLELYVNKIEGA